MARDVLRRLSAFPVDIYIIPGNHDHTGAGSIYSTGVFQQVPPNVHVLLEPQPVEINPINTVLFPCPVRQKRAMLIRRTGYLKSSGSDPHRDSPRFSQRSWFR